MTKLVYFWSKSVTLMETAKKTEYVLSYESRVCEMASRWQHYLGLHDFIWSITGEVLRLTQVARGLDSEGVLLIDIVINGFVPPSLSSSHLSLQVSHLKSNLNNPLEKQ